MTARLAVSDNLSGKDYSEFSFDGGAAWQQLPGTNETFVISGNGATRFLYRSMDIAGNVEQTKDSGPIIINRYLVFSNGANNSLRVLYSTSVDAVGDFHSNGSLDILYNTSVAVAGTVETVSGGNNVSGNTRLQIQSLRTGATPVTMLQYPLNFYAGIATVVFPTDLIIDSTSKVISGTIYSAGDITLMATKLSGPVTFVAGRDLKDMSTSGVFQTADPYNGVVIFAGRNISLGGTVNMPFGLLYAPNGTISIGSTIFDLKGSLVADQVEIKAATVRPTLRCSLRQRHLHPAAHGDGLCPTPGHAAATPRDA